MNELDDKLTRGLHALAGTIQPERDPMAAVGATPMTDGPRRRGPLLVAAAIVVGLTIAATFAWSGRNDKSVVGTSDPGTTSTAGPAPAAPGGTMSVPPKPVTWRMLPPSPFGQVWPLVTMSQGGSVFVWRAAQTDGSGRDLRAVARRSAVFDLETETWRELPADPLGDIVEDIDSRSGGAFVHREAVFWAGGRVTAWDPFTDSRRSLASPPRPVAHDGVATHDHVVFPLDGLMFSPYENRWWEIARPSPTLVAGVNTAADGMTYYGGDYVVVVGRSAGIYNLETNTWVELGAPRDTAGEIRSPDVSDRNIGWDGNTVTVFVDRNHGGGGDGPPPRAPPDPWAATWATNPGLIVAPPIHSCESAPTILTQDDDAGDVVIASNCSETARFAGPDGGWQPITAPEGRLVLAGNKVLSYRVWPTASLSVYEID